MELGFLSQTIVKLLNSILMNSYISDLIHTVLSVNQRETTLKGHNWISSKSKLFILGQPLGNTNP